MSKFIVFCILLLLLNNHNNYYNEFIQNNLIGVNVFTKT